MVVVTIRELRNHGGEVVDRVERGEHLILTKAGRPVAKLSPLRPPPLPAATLLARWRALPAVDLRELRDDLDAVLDSSL